MDFNGSRIFKASEFAEKYIMADGTIVGCFFIVGFSYRLSGMGHRICNSYCDSPGFSYSYGNGKDYETAGSLLYDLLHSGMQCRTASDAFAGYRMAYHEESPVLSVEPCLH